MMTYRTSSSYLCQRHILYMEIKIAVCLPPSPHNCQSCTTLTQEFMFRDTYDKWIKYYWIVWCCCEFWWFHLIETMFMCRWAVSTCPLQPVCWGSRLSGGEQRECLRTAGAQDAGAGPAGHLRGQPLWTQ